MGFLYNAIILFGVFIAYLAGYFLANDYWRIAFLIPVIFCTTRIIVFRVRYTLDTPYSYVIQNDHTKCREALAGIYHEA